MSETKPVKTYNTSLPKLNLTASNLQVEWNSWVLQYKIFLRATNLESEDDKRKVSLLLHHMGGEVLDIFKSFNLDLDQVTHEALLKKFSDYFSPKKNITMERNRFFTKRQSPDQNIMEFVTELRNLAKSCEFPETDSIVRDIFICNMRNDYNYVKQKLLEDGNLTLEKALEVATSLVASREHVSILETDSNEINKIYHQSRNFNRGRSSSQDHRSQGHQRSVSRQSHKNGQSSQTSSQLTTSCQKCGQIHRVRCPAWGKTCAKCGRRNHFAKMCKIMSVKNIGEHYVNEELPIQEFHVGSIQSANSWDIEMEINGQVTSAQVDTGSQVNIISSSMGAVLMHGQNPIAYASKSLSDCQQRYSQIEKELLAIVFGCVKYHSYIYDNKLEQIKVKTDNDPQLSRVKCCVLDGWPPKNKVDDDLRQFYSFKDDLHLVDGILFKKRSILIPASLRKEMLQRMHTGHLGIQKTKQLVRGVIYWPGMNEDISHMIDSCPVCLKFRKSNQKQPLLPHTIPSLPWQKLGMDLFHFESKNYLIMVDYYSQYFEICCVNSYNAQTIITQCKSVWSRHGIPCQIVSDGGPPFNSQDFARFCQSWDIEHVKTSPHYSKSNGLVERTIQSVKNIMKKCKESNSDVYLGLLQFRNAPKAEGIESPAKLLMSRQLRSNIPTSESTLKPSPINIENEKQKMYKKQSKMKFHYDKKAKFLPKVYIGENVLFKLNPKSHWTPAIITEEVIPMRSYRVQSPEGVTYQRNREHILKSSNSCESPSPSPEKTPSSKGSNKPTRIRFQEDTYF
ncbi:hypothetical protein M8J77_018030 [Diaphorina citri]|nr:hypothetical protein M8J77_018030 [Diaphorina citri]